MIGAHLREVFDLDPVVVFNVRLPQGEKEGWCAWMRGRRDFQAGVRHLGEGIGGLVCLDERGWRDF